MNVRVLTTVSYYSPHVSGLTVCVRRLVEGLVEKGFSFSVLTSQHRKDLPLVEEEKGAEIRRVPVWFTLGKVPITPKYLFYLCKELRRVDLVWIHLPQAEGILTAMVVRLMRKPIVVTVHCLPLLPSGWQRVGFQRLFDLVNNLVIKMASRVIYYTQDYAENTDELWHFPAKSSYILPPAASTAGRSKQAGRPVGFRREKRSLMVGFAGRMAEDKGVEYLVKAIQLIKAEGQRVKLMVAGSRRPVGEGSYAKRMTSLIDKSGVEVEYLGEIPENEMRGFYQQIDVLVLPSVNRTEAFGMVQVEAMKCGVPVVASDLPGVRQPVELAGRGLVVRPRDSAALAEGIKRAAALAGCDPAEVEGVFLGERTISDYEEVLRSA